MQRIQHFVTLLFLISFISALSISPLHAESDASETVRQSANYLIPHIIRSSTEKMPEWVKRTDFSLHFEDNFKPLWSIETVQPLYSTKETKQHTFFIHDRFAHTQTDDTLNCGIGYRYLSPEKNILTGLNAFYDYTFDRRHKRLGVGGEMILSYGSIHANYYEAISGHRVYLEDTSFGVTEKALDGWDVEANMQIPYTPWAQFSMKGYGWEGITMKDVNGFRISFRANLSKNVTCEFGRSNDDGGHNNFFRIGVTLGGPKRVQYTMLDNFFTRTVFSKKDLSRQTLAKVRRTQTIVVEKVRNAPINTGGIFIGRGT